MTDTARTPHAVEIPVSGEIDLANADELIGRPIAAELASGAPRAIVLEMAGVTFMDSSGVSALVSARAACGRHGVDLRLRAPSAQVVRLLEITALGPYFPIVD